MRIVAGDFRGRTIDAPTGDDTRPTIDRVRESLFSMLYSRLGGFSDCVVLDAFAGSGALGLEAISRGADSVCFYERDAAAAKVIQRNLDHFDLHAPRVTLKRSDIFVSPPVRPYRKFNLVLLDPPYATDPKDVLGLVDKLSNSGALENDVLVCYEHSCKTDLSPYLDGEFVNWEEATTRKYGKVGVTLLTKRAE